MDRSRAAILRQKLSELPQFSVARLPTPLDEAPRFSAAVGHVRILVKREDMTGLAFGGNKTRELDFFVGDALKAEADVFIAGGGVAQSNHAVQCAAAARRAGMTPVMVLRPFRAEETQGNLFLDRLLGVDVRFAEASPIDHGIDRGAVPREPSGQSEIADTMTAVADEYRSRGHRPYVLPSSFHPLAAVAYAGCALELREQLEARSIRADHLYLTSTGATQAGLVMGARYLEWPVTVTGISSSGVSHGLTERLLRLATQGAERLGISPSLTATDFRNESFAGPGYGIVTRPGVEAICLLARTEGMFLDPVYTGKGMAGLIAHIRTGRIKPGSTVVFVHTGGLPGLFAYTREILSMDVG